MTKFEKPEPRGWSHPEPVAGAVDAALQDAGLPYERLEGAYGAGFRRSGAARPVHRGQDRPPITTASNACATGSSALFSARQSMHNIGLGSAGAVAVYRRVS